MILVGAGVTGHERHGTSANKFKYPLFFLNFPVGEEAQLRALLRSKFWLFSFRASDYLWRKPGTLEANIKEYLKAKCAYDCQDVSLVTVPRFLNYAFNPVSFWFCRRDGVLEGVLSEVNNTFGERHFYWTIPAAEGFVTLPKSFHVSPFLATEGHYEFSFADSAVRTNVTINYFDSNGSMRLSTYVALENSPLESWSQARLLSRFGLVSFSIIFRIHYQALRLWLKRAQFYGKPDLPAKDVTL